MNNFSIIKKKIKKKQPKANCFYSTSQEIKDFLLSSKKMLTYENFGRGGDRAFYMNRFYCILLLFCSNTESIGLPLIYLLISNYLQYINATIIKCRFIEI